MLGRALIGIIRLYQVAISPLTPPTCRYTPSCSAYAREAIEVHGAARGGWLAFRRVLRCHPWGGHGYDPVPGWMGVVSGTGREDQLEKTAAGALGAPSSSEHEH